MNKKNRFRSKKVEKLSKGFGLSYWKIFDISLFGRSMDEVLKIVEDWIESRAKGKFIVTVNPEFIMRAIKDGEFRNLLKETDLNVVDGVGLLWARELGHRSLMLDRRYFIKKLLMGMKVGGEILRGKHRENLVSGSDLVPEMSKLAAKNGYKVFFLGGFGDRAKRTAEFFVSKNSDHRLSIIDRRKTLQAGWSSGEPEVSNEEVIKQVNEFKPDILFVAYGMKKQEEWILNNRDKVDFGVAVGVGRSFDYYSGDLKRAPKIWRKMGMEWLYSLIKEPKRWRRQLELPKFVWRVLNN